MAQSPKSIIIYTHAHGDGLRMLKHECTDRNLVYWQINDRVNTEFRERWLKRFLMDSGFTVTVTQVSSGAAKTQCLEEE